MLSILIGLACIAIIVAFAEHLIAGLLWIGVAALALAGIALALVVLMAVAPYLGALIELLTPLLLAGLAVLAICLGAHAVRLVVPPPSVLLRKVRGISSPKSWSADGAATLGWVLLASALLFYFLALAISRGDDPPPVVLNLSLVGVVAALAFVAVGGWWKLAALLRHPRSLAQAGLVGAVATGSSFVLIGGVMARIESEGIGGVLLAVGGFLMFVGGAVMFGAWSERSSPKTTNQDLPQHKEVRGEREAA